MVLAVVVAMLIAAIVLIKFVTAGTTGVSVPDVRGDSVAAARTAITGAGLKVSGVSDQTSNTVTKGQVISTSPSYGQTEPKGTPVTIIESSGPATKMVNVPSVVNMTRGAAIAKLTDAGFKVKVETTSSAGYAPNTVVNQSPLGDTPAKAGSTVTISVTARQLKVPNVINLTAQAAQTTLQSPPYNYMVTTVQGAGPGGYAVGTVYATSPGVGSALGPGSPITIYVVEAASSSPSVTPSTSPSTSPSPSPSSTPPFGQNQPGKGNGQAG